MSGCCCGSTHHHHGDECRCGEHGTRRARHGHGACSCERHHHGHEGSRECGCGGGHECECHEERLCECGCGGPVGGHGTFQRRFSTREERLNWLRAYLEDLRTEARAVEEHIAAIEAEG